MFGGQELSGELLNGYYVNIQVNKLETPLQRSLRIGTTLSLPLILEVL